MRDVLTGLNSAIAILRNAVDDPHTGWNATLPLPHTRGSGSSLTVPMFVTRTSASDWSIRGAAQSTIDTSQRSALTGVGGGFPGGGRGGGFPGGSFPSGIGGGFPGGGGGEIRRGGRSGSAGNSPISLIAQIEGRVHNGALARLSIVETRTVTLEGMPFTNTSGWIIEASSGP